MFARRQFMHGTSAGDASAAVIGIRSFGSTTRGAILSGLEGILVGLVVLLLIGLLGG